MDRVNIGSIQIAQTAPLEADALTRRGELNAFPSLLNGILNTDKVGVPSLKAPQSGNQTVNRPALFGQNTGKDAVEKANREKDQPEPQRMVSHAAPEPVLPVAEAPLFVAAPQIQTKRDVSVVPVGRLTPNSEQEPSAAPPCPVANGDTRGTRTLPLDAPPASQGDVAFALRIFPKTAGFQNTASVGERSGTPWQWFHSCSARRRQRMNSFRWRWRMR